MPVHEIKFVLLGASGVGKSSIFRRLITNTFSAKSESTLGAAYVELWITETEDGLKMSRARDTRADRVWRVHIWDTAGQERYRSLLPMYYRGANVVAVVHDGTAPAVQNAKESLDDLGDAWTVSGTALAMCQNKSDLPGAELVEELAQDKRVVVSDMISALTGDGVERFFLNACRPYIDFRNSTRELSGSVQEDPLINVSAEYTPASRCCS